MHYLKMVHSALKEPDDHVMKLVHIFHFLGGWMPFWILQEISQVLSNLEGADY